MLNLFEAKKSEKKDELKVNPSLGESCIELRQHLGNNTYLMCDGDFLKVLEIHPIFDEALTIEELDRELTPFQRFVSLDRAADV